MSINKKGGKGSEMFLFGQFSLTFGRKIVQNLTFSGNCPIWIKIIFELIK